MLIFKSLNGNFKILIPFYSRFSFNGINKVKRLNRNSGKRGERLRAGGSATGGDRSSGTGSDSIRANSDSQGGGTAKNDDSVYRTQSFITNWGKTGLFIPSGRNRQKKV